MLYDSVVQVHDEALGFINRELGLGLGLGLIKLLRYLDKKHPYEKLCRPLQIIVERSAEMMMMMKVTKLLNSRFLRFSRSKQPIQRWVVGLLKHPGR